MPPPPPPSAARGSGLTFQGRRRPKDPKLAAEFDEKRRLHFEAVAAKKKSKGKACQLCCFHVSMSAFVLHPRTLSQGPHMRNTGPEQLWLKDQGCRWQ